MKAKRYLGYVIAALVVYWIIVHPLQAADTARRLTATLTDAAEAAAVFVNALT